MWMKGVRKFKGLRFILVNSQIFNSFMAFVSIVVKATKHYNGSHYNRNHTIYVFTNWKLHDIMVNIDSMFHAY